MMGGGMMGGGMWNPNAICDGKRAEERAMWLQQNQGMTPMAAQQQVMREFPAQFGGGMMGGGMMGGGMMGPGCAPAMGSGMWNPNVICDGKRAEERAIWLQQNQGLAPMVAQQQVMREFPAQFGGGMIGGGMMGGGMWNPNALCDGKRAEDRAMWLQQNQGLAPMVAQQQVMREFPSQFGMM